MNNDKFISFLNSITTKHNSALIESIKHGFKVCFESDEMYQEAPELDYYSKIQELRKIAPELFIPPERMKTEEFKEKWPKIEARRKELMQTHPHLFR